MVYSWIKYLLQDNNKLYKGFRRSNTNAQLHNKLNHLQEKLNFLINRSKQNYYARMTKKLTNVSKNCKAYWSLLRCLLNNRKYSNSTFVSGNKFVMVFKEKAELFNSHFATHCSLISNSSKLPSHIQYLTDNCLSCVGLSHDKIAKVI